MYNTRYLYKQYYFYLHTYIYRKGKYQGILYYVCLR